MVGNVFELFQIRVINRTHFHQLLAGIARESLENLRRALQGPNNHDIGIRTAVNSGRGAIRISGMKIIRSHDPANMIAC